MSNHMAAAVPADTDPRLPVRLLAPDEAPPAGAALLVEGEPPAPLPGWLTPATAAFAQFDLPAPAAIRHAIGCLCCGISQRNPAAAALNRLFLRRVRGEAPFFGSVAVLTRSEAGAAAIRDALAGDPVTRARFRTG